MSMPSSLSTLSSSTLSDQSTEQDRNTLYTYILDRWDALGAELKDQWRARRDEWHAFAGDPVRGVPSREVDCFELHSEMVELDEIIWDLEASGAVDLKEDERAFDGLEGDGEHDDGVEGGGQDAEMAGGDDERAVDALLEAVEKVYDEEDGEEDGEDDKGDGDDPESGRDDGGPRRSSWRKCPVPGCDVKRNRLSRINQHLRDDHDVPLETGVGGDMIALRARQDQQFAAWCVANGLRGDIPREQPIDGEML